MQLEIQPQAVGANQHIAQSEMVLTPPAQPDRKIPDISPLTGPPGKGQRRAFSRRAAKRGRAAGNLERRSPELTGIPFRALIATLPPKSPLDSALLMMKAIIRARQMFVKAWASKSTPTVAGRAATRLKCNLRGIHRAIRRSNFVEQGK